MLALIYVNMLICQPENIYLDPYFSVVMRARNKRSRA